MNTAPLEYQNDAVTKVSTSLVKTGMALLEAGMGTGKTFMSLMTNERMKKNKLLIVCPKTLISGWIGQMKQHANLEPSIVWDGVKYRQSDKFKKAMDAVSKSGYGIMIVNTEAFQKEQKELFKMVRTFVDADCGVIIDESSKVKDPGASRTKHMSKLFTKSAWNLCMTGTMNANSPLDVYGQFMVLSPNFWPSQGFRTWHLFKNHFAILEECYGPNGVTFKKITGYRRLAELKLIIDPFITEVKKEEVLDLPEKVFEHIAVALTPKEQKAYDDMKRVMMTTLDVGITIAADQALSLYNKFRMITGGWIETETPIVEEPAKLSTLMEILSDTTEQVLIFANFSHEVSQIAQALSETRKVAIYDGSVPMNERTEIVERFNAGKIDTIVAQPLAGAYGLNLQSRCNSIIYYSLPNSPEVFLQSQDRIHRMGQSKTCFYTVLEAASSIDQQIFKALQAKEDLSRMFRSNPLQHL